MKPYYEGNHEGFEADTFLASKVKQLIQKLDIKEIWETGTYFGNTTRRFSLMADRVHTCEIDQKHYDIAKKNLQANDNVTIHLKSSPVMLDEVVRYKTNDAKVLVYLDAHFNGCPLLDELEVFIKHSYIPSCIIVHDFVVPGHPELGHDEYNGQKLEWEWIKPSIEKIYGEDGYQIEYNSEATGAKRGVIFITSKA